MPYIGIMENPLYFLGTLAAMCVLMVYQHFVAWVMNLDDEAMAGAIPFLIVIAWAIFEPLGYLLGAVWVVVFTWGLGTRIGEWIGRQLDRRAQHHATR